MYNDYFPWWDAQIGISFTREEWETILHELKQLYAIPDFPANDYDMGIVNIMDRIEKNLGTE